MPGPNTCECGVTEDCAAHEKMGVGFDVLSAQLQRLQPKIAGSGVSLQDMLSVANEMEPIR